MARIPIFGGLFADISNRWYTIVGASILTTVLINLFLPLVPLSITLLNRLLLPLTSRFVKTQNLMNELYLGQDFTLSARYGSFLATLYICYMYSAGMPIMLLVGSAYFGLSFIIDKVCQ
jgi:hypothetical protein